MSAIFNLTILIFSFLVPLERLDGHLHRACSVSGLSWSLQPGNFIEIDQELD
jgi:hypothetical protein